jgi:DNA-binding NarL/FixJ family response regulator
MNEDMNLSANTSAKEPGVIAARGALSALIVDDEAHARAYTRLLLTTLGVNKVWEASGAAEALEQFSERHPSVVVMDINMPMMAGDVLMAKLLAIDPEVAVIVMTSESDIKTVRRFQELGAIGYLLKQSPRDQVTELLGVTLDSLIDYDGTD